ncbi:nucleoside permease [Orbaceae bacterium ESL0721]|nr:nucleoside permease [Orbaceae bacterium ESL0721]
MKKTEYKLSIMMFLEWFIWGAWFVPLFQLLQSYQFTPFEISCCFASTSIGAIISPIFIGTVADRFIAAEKLLSLLMLAGAIILFFVMRQTEFSTFFPLLLCYALTYMPTLALTNSIVFAHVSDGAKLFPRIRVMGTIGWIVSGITCGFLPSWLGFDDIANTTIPLIITAIGSIALALYALWLPPTPPDPNKTVSLAERFGLKALVLLKDRSFLIFFICSFLFSIPLAFYYNYANGFLESTGMSNATGWMTLGQASEIFFMLVLPLFLKRFGIKTVLLLGLITAAIRYIAFAYGNADDGLHYALLFFAILLHGVSYDFYSVSAFIYVDQHAPKQMRSSAQSLIVLGCQGVGGLLGYQLGGYIVDRLFTHTTTTGITYNWSAIWYFGAAMITVIALIMFFCFKPKTFSLTKGELSNEQI